jgi:hypothetical protein
MRLLIGLYLAAAAVLVAMSAAIGFLGVRSLAVRESGARQGSSGEEALMIAVIALMTALIPLLVGYGLWKRWQLVRVGLLVLSCWTAFASLCASVAALATLTGLTTGKELGIDEPPGVTLGTAAALVALSVWQAWVLTRPAVRASFAPIRAGK